MRCSRSNPILPAVLLFLSLLAISLPAHAISCYSNFGIVRDVDPDHLKNQAKNIQHQLAAAGSPLDPAEIALLDQAALSPAPLVRVRSIQRVLDGHSLIALSISSEVEIKATPGPALPFLAQGRWNGFLIKVDNLSRQALQLLVQTENGVHKGNAPASEAWFEYELWPENSALTGERVDYLVLRLRSAERGKREALFAFSTASRPLQQPGPLSYNRLPVLFSLVRDQELAQTKLAHLLRHQHLGLAPGPTRRGPALLTIRAAACLDCHDAAPIAQPPAVIASPQLHAEQSCVACHRELAAGTPAAAPCPVCGMINCKMKCVARDTSNSNTPVMRMAGLPRWLFFTAVALILGISFVAVELLERRSSSPRASEGKSFRQNLFAWPIAARLARQSWFRPALQWPVFLVFCFMVYAGFAGDSLVNITPVLTWTIWWSSLIALVLFLGKAWCFICPWEFSATLLQSIPKLWGRQRLATLGLRWPRQLRNIYLAAGLFVLLTWLELGYGVTSSARATAWLALLMAALAILPALLFDRRAFCRYGCMIGRISGLYALFAPVEIRSASVHACRQCKTRDCYHGNDQAPGCPTALFLPAVRENTYCVSCGYCARSCPTHNVAFNLRPFGADLLRFRELRSDESLLAIILLALTSFHGLTMTPVWNSATGTSVITVLRQLTGFGPLAAFTAGMAVMLALPVLLYWACCWLTSMAVPSNAVSTRKLFLGFAASLLPVALFYHLAHNSMHLFMEAQYLLPLLSNPLGHATDFFGTASLRPGPILSAETIWYLQVALILIGHVFGIVAAHHAARRLYPQPRHATAALFPMLSGMILFSWYSLWLLHLDMNMHTSLM